MIADIVAHGYSEARDAWWVHLFADGGEKVLDHKIEVPYDLARMFTKERLYVEVESCIAVLKQQWARNGIPVDWSTVDCKMIEMRGAP